MGNYSVSTAIPVVAFLLVALMLVVFIFFGSNQPSDSKGQKMKFTWNDGSQTLVSDDPDISVRVLGLEMRGDAYEFVLTIRDRHIGFSTVVPTEKTKEGQHVWTVDGVGIYVSRGGNKGTIYARPTLFVDKSEQDLALNLIVSALSQFHAANFDNSNANSIVRFTDELNRKIANGELIAGSP